MWRPLATCAMLLCLAPAAPSQVIEFESNGLKYQTLTHRGVTVMYAHLSTHLRDFRILQVAVSNGSDGPYTIRPEDFRFQRTDGTVLHASPARDVVSLLIAHGGANEVVKLVSAYENAIYGIPHMRLTNGYESRRQAALAMATNTKLRAAAAASAIALVQTKLTPGQSTDGAVFFPVEGKALGAGRVIVETNTDTFEFNPEPGDSRQ